ncbi:hypothetical protein QS306_14505 [Paraburkholderia bonniea]|nr:hypothetical protein [Paraburkholderia bonniea]WJF91980.1 hypothetical protein QS306_14505 [Paraburkholderia bonniea]WJF95299.1 hypothetical protein QS308_14510 [Paraburkholderia bonniea]
MAFCTARPDVQQRLPIVAMDGQHTPLSFALSASEISTTFWTGDMP